MTHADLISQWAALPASSLRFALADDAGGRFVIDAATGVISVASEAVLAAEKGAVFSVLVETTGDDGIASLARLTLQVTAMVPEGVGPEASLFRNPVPVTSWNTDALLRFSASTARAIQPEPTPLGDARLSLSAAPPQFANEETWAGVLV